MKKTLLALAVAGAAVVAAGPVFAQSAVITFDPGNVAYGYSDGYWSRDHVWHSWEKPEYVEVYRKHPGARYHEWAHTRDPNEGWVEITR